jgi:hypothetical protein
MYKIFKIQFLLICFLFINLVILNSCNNNSNNTKSDITGTYENVNQTCRIYLYPNGKFIWVNGEPSLSNSLTISYNFNTNKPDEIGTYELINENGIQEIRVKVKAFFDGTRFSIDDRHRFSISGSQLIEKGSMPGSFITFNKINN